MQSNCMHVCLALRLLRLQVAYSFMWLLIRLGNTDAPILYSLK